MYVQDCLETERIYGLRASYPVFAHLPPGLFQGRHREEPLVLEVEHDRLGLLPHAARHHHRRLVDGDDAVVVGRPRQRQSVQRPPAVRVARAQHLDRVERSAEVFNRKNI